MSYARGVGETYTTSESESVDVVGAVDNSGLCINERSRLLPHSTTPDRDRNLQVYNLVLLLTLYSVSRVCHSCTQCPEFATVVLR